MVVRLCNWLGCKGLPIAQARLMILSIALAHIVTLLSVILVITTGDVSLMYAWLYAGICQALIIEGTKWILNHTTLGQRPNGRSYGFPCDYTAGAFYGALFIAVNWGWWGIWPLAVATTSGIGFVVARTHWPRDVIAGALIAITCTMLVTHHI